ncbi:pseudouridine synthase [Backusella circina FSU 941]|nr:pseudouridine synthase [Backusella circina FSU 941]
MEERLKQPIEVIFNDDDFFIINKPYDCRIQNYPNATDPSVESILKEQFPHISKFRNVHQLDYATSGVFVLALNKKAAASASLLFKERSVKKSYLALVTGHLKEQSYFIDKPIGDDPNHAFRMCIEPTTGKAAQTQVEVLLRGHYKYKEEKTGIEKVIPVSKVKLSPISGRRHQLRVHLRSIGHPIIGDFNYEDVYTDTFRMMLHAHEIMIPLPGKSLRVNTKDPFIALIE